MLTKGNKIGFGILLTSVIAIVVIAIVVIAISSVDAEWVVTPIATAAIGSYLYK